MRDIHADHILYAPPKSTSALLKVLGYNGAISSLIIIIISASLSINIVSVSVHGIELWSIPSVSFCVGLTVGLCVRKMYCGEMADWIWMPFGTVSRVGQRIGVLDGVVIVKEEEAVLGVNLGHPIETNGDFVA